MIKLRSFLSTSISFILLFNISGFSQTKLEVEGPIVISSDADQSPKEGTIRWNDAYKDFEGWTGIEWKSLTKNQNTWGGNIAFQNLKINQAITNQYMHYGHSLKMFSDYVIIGAPQEEFTGVQSGTAYIHKYDGNWWVQEGKLVPSDGADLDFFGAAVDIYGDYAIVGAYRADEDNNFGDTGLAYIFKRNGSNWNEIQKLEASDFSEFGWFGFSVAIEGDYAMIGALDFLANDVNGGSVYVFHYDGSSWVEEAKLQASDGSAGNQFGFSIAMEGTQAVIGAVQDNNIGSAYVYKLVNNVWTEQAKLNESNLTNGAAFGASVDISSSLVIIGAFNDDVENINSGSVFIYEKGGNTWVQTSKITSPNNYQNGNFGRSVSISNGTLLVGAPLERVYGIQQGKAYVFQQSGSAWLLESELGSTSEESNNEFGWSSHILNNNIIIGAPSDEIPGAAYYFKKN